MHNPLIWLFILSRISKSLNAIKSFIPIYKDVSPGIKKAYNLVNNYSLKRKNTSNYAISNSKTKSNEKPENNNGNPVFFK